MIRVLIAAGAPMARLLLASIRWEALRAEAVVAGTKEEALHAMRERSPDLLLVEDGAPFEELSKIEETGIQVVRLDPCALLNQTGPVGKREAGAPAGRDTGGSRAIRRARAYLEQNFAEPLRLDDVADYVKLNPAYFSALFKKETGKTFSDYLVERRLRAAQYLLQSTGKSISEIAETVGYNDVKYFSKLFKKHMGVKPSEYRRISP